LYITNQGTGIVHTLPSVHCPQASGTYTCISSKLLIC